MCQNKQKIRGKKKRKEKERTRDTHSHSWHMKYEHTFTKPPRFQQIHPSVATIINWEGVGMEPITKAHNTGEQVNNNSKRRKHCLCIASWARLEVIAWGAWGLLTWKVFCFVCLGTRPPTVGRVFWLARKSLIEIEAEDPPRLGPLSHNYWPSIVPYKPISWYLHKQCILNVENTWFKVYIVYQSLIFFLEIWILVHHCWYFVSYLAIF